ncbi:autoinducer binding domain-containing protein [Chromobacterium piscinae]|uniref:autoinducer binding domain-containing protein n=1 Tax=Chromobacterium piscinae TaxID=686831 RepID=UPI003F7E0E00
MATAIDQLPEVAAISNNRINAAICAAAALRSMLVRARTRDDLDAALALVCTVAGGAPTLLATFYGTRVPSLYINHGWSEDWLLRYVERGYGKIDPIVRASAGEPVVWSTRLYAPGLTQAQRRFVADCENHELTHGLTYIADKGGGVRYVLSMIGRQVEDDRALRDLLEMLLPDLAEVAHRVFASNARIAKTSKIQQTVIDLYCKRGFKRTEVASALGKSVYTIDYHIGRLMETYEASTVEQLMYKIGACE